jgi:hypothetical protein
MCSQCVLQVGNRVTLLQPGRQDMGREVVVRAELGSEDGLTVIPESVDAVEQAGFVGGMAWLGKQPVEQHSSHLALQGAELDHRDCSRTRNRLRHFNCLAFEDGRVTCLMVCRSRLWRSLLLGRMTARSSRCGLVWYEGHAVDMCGLHGRCRRYGCIRYWRRSIRCARCMRSISSTRRMRC